MSIVKTAKSLALSSSLALVIFACNRNTASTQDSTNLSQNSVAPSPDAPIMLRGTIVSVSANQLALKSDTGTVTVGLPEPLRLYVRAPSDLSKVKDNSFIGVTTVHQPDGSERATEIHVFPEELRGVGEGSRMMGPDVAAAPSRMTNGNVSTRMTNGTGTQSRMSNGSVTSTTGSSLVVQYAGGSQTVTVPPNTPVTELKLASRGVTAGDQVALLAKKAPDGSLTADKAISTTR
jgi:hypothetical protein